MMPDSLNLADSLADTMVAFKAAALPESAKAGDMSSNYVVMAVTLMIWIGIFIYLMVLDRKTKKLEVKK